MLASHSVKDADVVLGVVAALKNQGLKVYVDWLVDPQIDSSRLTPETAERLRQRMRQSSALVYAHSNQSGSSKSMPLRLGTAVRSKEWVGDFSRFKINDLEMVDLTCASSNPLIRWLRRIDCLRRAA